MLASLAFSGERASAGVHIVDHGGAGDFVEIQTAVNAAADGDTLFVRKGAYAGFSVVGKSLWIVADKGALVTVAGTVAITNQTIDTVVVLAGLTVEAAGGSGSSSNPALSLVNDVGHVRAQGCVFKGASGTPNRIGGSGANIVSSFSVAFEQCSFIGGPGFIECPEDPFCNSTYESGGDGVSTSGSASAFYDCTLRGGNAATNKWQAYAGDGGHGIEVVSFGFFASGCLFEGGDGGIASDFAAPHGGNGGHGVRVVAGGAQLLDNQYIGGAGGIAPDGFPGTPGSPTQGNAQFHSGTKRLCSASVQVASGGSLSVTFTGEPGDRVYLPMDDTSFWRFSPARRGVWLLPQPVRLDHTPIAILPASGTATVAVPMAQLPSSESLRQVFAQSFFRTTQGENFLGAPLHIAVRNCSALTPDCNGNGAGDLCDVSDGTSVDSNGNLTPDECDPPSAIWWVDASAAPGGDGSASNPFRAISEGINVAINGDIVRVRDGMYTGAANRSLDFAGRIIRIESENGPANCIIDAQGIGHAFRVHDQLGNEAAVISGFTMLNGFDFLNGTEIGGAIDLLNSSPTIENCVFESCVGDGAAIGAKYSNSTIRGCTFQNNEYTAVQLLAGSGSLELSPKLVDCTFIGNMPFGAVDVTPSNDWGVLISHCSMLDNRASSLGGAISLIGFHAAKPCRVENCLFAGNIGAEGGAIGGTQSLIVRDCTFAGNQGHFRGGAIARGLNADASLVENCVFWDNVSPIGAQIALRGSATNVMTVRYSDVQGGQPGVSVDIGSSLIWGAGNLSLDPLFIDPDGPDNDVSTLTDNVYRLALSSPCIDAGDTSALPLDDLDLDGDLDTSEFVPFDLDFLLRRFDIPGVADTGVGPAPVVDIGAFERRP